MSTVFMYWLLSVVGSFSAGFSVGNICKWKLVSECRYVKVALFASGIAAENHANHANGMLAISTWNQFALYEKHDNCHYVDIAING